MPPTKRPTTVYTRTGTPLTVHTLEVFYSMCCTRYGIPVDPSVISTLKTNSHVLRPYSGSPYSGASYSEAHWLALCQLLLFPFASHPSVTNFLESGFSTADKKIIQDLRDGTTPDFIDKSTVATPISSLWFRWRSVAGTNHGVLLGRVLEVNHYIVELNLERNKINSDAAAEMAKGLRNNTTLRILNLHGNHLNFPGIKAICEALHENITGHAIEKLDVSNCNITYDGVTLVNRLVAATNEKRLLVKNTPMVANIEMNTMAEEVGNAITHGLGAAGSLCCLYLLVSAATGKSGRTLLSAWIYGLSLCITFLSSCLYHSFFKLGVVSAIFHRLDHGSIFLLIAGTFTPILSENLTDWFWSPFLLVFSWFSAVAGLGIVCLAFGQCPRLQLAMYLGMGWTGALVAPKYEELPPNLCTMIVLGGLFYTGGVYFFVSPIPAYHIIWHVFVMLGAMCHFIGIYYYSF